MRIAVIGSGMAGLCAAKHSANSGYDVTVYEQSKTIGGTWVFSNNIGKDEYGLDVHSSMYKGLHTNLPKEIMGYPDFPIPDSEKSYISAEDMLSFLNLYANTFSVKNYIKFQHHVIRITVKGTSQWEVIVRDLPNDKLIIKIYDAVLICNGHYHTPLYPNYDGKNVYKGLQIHSHDYRCPDPFKDEEVLVIGAGPSGMDLAYEISSVAKRLTLSHHHKEKPKTKFSSNVDQRGDVLRLTETGVEFVDGSHQTYSVIFYCTGYRYTFPFISVECGITVENNYVKPLYKHCINISRPTMALIGLPFYVCASQMFDLQVRFFLKYLSGAKKFPSRSEMLTDTENEMKKRWERGYKKHQAHMMGPEQIEYYNDLSSTADIANLKPVITKIHNESSERFLDDVINFRKDIYRIIDDETFIKIKN